MSLVLLVGGARSGKSALAAQVAAAHGHAGDRASPPAEGPGKLEGASAEAGTVFIATAEPKDKEMEARIRSHRSLRPPDWATVEEPLHLEEALASAPPSAAVVVDCLTLWVSNLLGAGKADDEVLAYARSAADLAARRPGLTVVVSNEVGSGVVPFNALARRYRDLLGQVNAAFADQAASAYLVVAGRLLSLARPTEVLALPTGAGAGPSRQAGASPGLAGAAQAPELP